MCACNKQEVYYHISPWILKQMQDASPILSWLWNIRLGWKVLGVWNRKELKLTLINTYFFGFFVCNRHIVDDNGWDLWF